MGNRAIQMPNYGALFDYYKSSQKPVRAEQGHGSPRSKYEREGVFEMRSSHARNG
jgi:hypothetical protein